MVKGKPHPFCTLISSIDPIDVPYVSDIPPTPRSTRTPPRTHTYARARVYIHTELQIDSAAATTLDRLDSGWRAFIGDGTVLSNGLLSTGLHGKIDKHKKRL